MLIRVINNHEQCKKEEAMCVFFLCVSGISLVDDVLVSILAQSRGFSYSCVKVGSL